MGKNWATGLGKITAEKLSQKSSAKYRRVAQSESLLEWQRQNKRFDSEVS